MRTADRNAERGNVLFLILIAVALFAALSYVVTQSSRSGSGSIDRENAQLEAADAMSYLGEIRRAVATLIIRGCHDDQITFEGSGFRGGANGPYAGGAEMLPDGANPNAPTDKRCNVFHPNGGAVAPRILDKTAAASAPGSWARGGHIWFQMENLPGIGTDAGVDIIAVVPYVSEAVCTAWNKANDIGGENGDRVAIPWAAGGAPYNFAGTFTATMTGGTSGTYKPGTDAWCFCDDPTDCANFPASRQLAMIIMAR